MSDGFVVGDPEFTGDLDEFHRQLRHRQDVTAHVNGVAHQMRDLIPSEDFGVVEAGGPQRYRAYVGPANVHGANSERKHSWVLKALAAMVRG